MELATKKPLFKKYPAYKESGVDWLGEIPDKWKILPGLSFIIEGKDKNTGMKRDKVLSLSYGNIRVKGENELTGLVPESFETYQLVNIGDVIFRPTDLQNDKVSLRSAISNYNGIITSAYLNLRIKEKASAKFYHYLFRAIDSNKIVYGLGSGLRQNISYLDFRRFLFPFPPLSEQTAIANFLDDKTAKIDKAIAQKEKMIALLKERKQIIIQNAVTKGLDPNVKLKDSGVEWIGEIPEGWKVESFKNILIERNEKNDPIKSKERLSLSIDKGITLYAEKTTNLDRFKDDFSQYKIAHENDLVFNSMNMIVGAVGVSSFFGCVSPVYYTYYSKVRNKNITKFYEWFFKSRLVQSQLYSMGKGIMAIDRGNGKFNTVRLKVPRHELRSFKVSFPGEGHLNEIVEFIEKENKTTNKVILLQKTQIKKLKEYKATLIDSAVTGKIKVS